MVWKNTQKLGCGVSGSYLTCRYFPQGNILGQFEENVPRLLDDQNDSGNDSDDGGNSNPVPDDIQQQLDNYAANLPTPNSQCGVQQDNLTKFNGIRISCPAANHRTARVQYTDTAANWAQTIDHCDNVFIEETTSGNQVTRTYVAWGPAGVNTVAFWRPSNLHALQAHGLALLNSSFNIPSDTTAPSCANDGNDSDNNDDTNANND